MKSIKQLPIWLTLFFLFLFFLPFQEELHKGIRALSHWTFSNQTFPPYFEKKLDYYLCDLLLIGILISSFSLWRNRVTEILWKQKYLFGFLCLTLISLLFSSEAHHFWPYWRYAQLFLPLFGAAILAELLDVDSILTPLLLILLCTGLFESLLAIYQYAVQHPLGIKHLGEWNFHLFNGAAFTSPSHKRWIFDALLHTKNAYHKILRPYGTFVYPNILGGFLGMTIFASYYLFLQKRSVLIASAISLQIFALYLTFSRGALFGLIGCSILYLVYLFAAKHNSAKWLLLVVVCGCTLSTGILFEQLRDRGGVVNYNATAQGSDAPRKVYQSAALTLAKERPLLGHGWTQFLLALERSGKVDDSCRITTVHNIYLLLLAEVGAPALLCFLAAFGMLFYQTWNRGLDLTSVTLATILLYFLWFGCVDHYWINREQGRLMLFLVFALLSAHTRISVFNTENTESTEV